MGKIICEICGTAYPDTEEVCPVCGYSRDMNGQVTDEQLQRAAFDYAQASEEDYDTDFGEDYCAGPGEDCGAAPGAPGMEPEGMPPFGQKQVPEDGPVAPPEHGMFDFDAVNPGSESDFQSDCQNLYDEDLDGNVMDAAPQMPREGYASYEDLGDYDDEPMEPMPGYDAPSSGVKPRKQPVFLIIFLVVLNVALLAATSYLFFTFLLPGKLSERPAAQPETTAAVTTEPATTEPIIPCTSLVLTSSGKVELNRKGQFWLIHAKALPEDTTDKILYFSENDEVVTVTESGRVTAVGEGQANIIITCGLQQMVCPITVVYKEITETEPIMTHPVETGAPAESVPEETQAQTEAAAEAQTEAAAEAQTEAVTEAPTEAPAETRKPVNPDIQLKLKKNDILFKGLGLSTQLELDCDLAPEDVEWKSSDTSIILVDNGKVTTRNFGAATVTATYGDQEAKCVVRCAQP